MDAKGRTNHYLFYAQTLIKEISSPNSDERPSYTQALEMSACLQIKQCWHAWLAELGQLTKRELDASDFFGGLRKLDESGQRLSMPPELQLIEDRLTYGSSRVGVLKVLFEDPLGWLDELRSQSHEPEKVKDPLSIAVVDVDAEVSQPLEEVLLSICAELKEYIYSVREQQTEW